MYALLLALLIAGASASITVHEILEPAHGTPSHVFQINVATFQQQCRCCYGRKQSLYQKKSRNKRASPLRGPRYARFAIRASLTTLALANVVTSSHSGRFIERGGL